MEFKSFYQRRYQDKQIAILGFGREGQSSYLWLRQLGVSGVITLIDENLANLQAWQVERPAEMVEVRAFKEGGADLNQFDLIFRTPGFSKTKLTAVNPSRLTSQTNEFLLTQAPRTIAITGTKGKSTTSWLTAAVLQRLGLKVRLVGNIGQPALDLLIENESIDWFVYEMSSYQVENITVAPAIGVVINLFEEHLDHYADFADYVAAKLRLISLPNQRLAIYGTNNQLLKSYRSLIQAAKVRGFGLKTNRLADDAGIYLDTEQQQIVKIDAQGEQMLLSAQFERRLRGQHNLLNALVSLVVAEELVGLNAEQLSQAQTVIAELNGLEHRLEYVGNFAGIDFYNDSISTIPEALERAVEAIDNTQTVIIGGFNRGINHDQLVDYLNARPELKVICLPETGHLVFERLTNVKQKVANLEEAVRAAYQMTESGRACLLSPAATSYTFFANFEERGRIFKEYVQTFKHN